MGGVEYCSSYDYGTSYANGGMSYYNPNEKNYSSADDEPSQSVQQPKTNAMPRVVATQGDGPKNVGTAIVQGAINGIISPFGYGCGSQGEVQPTCNNEEINMDGGFISGFICSSPKSIHVYNGGELVFDSSIVELHINKMVIEKGSSIGFYSPSVIIDANYIEIDNSSILYISNEVTCGEGNGSDGQGGGDVASGSGGGGGSHIGLGGFGGNDHNNVTSGSGGQAYGLANDFQVEPGSCGGHGGKVGYWGGRGGRGGGAIIITSDILIVDGGILANGSNGSSGSYDDGGGGGGSGGSIMINSKTLLFNPLSTYLSVIGGNGGKDKTGYGGGGGAGGGGSIEILYGSKAQIGTITYHRIDYQDFINQLIQLNLVNYQGGIGGDGANNGQDGQPGGINMSLPE